MAEMRKWSWLCLVMILLAACSSGSSQAQSQLNVIRVVLLPFSGYAPIYLADADHLCTKYGINLQVIETQEPSAIDTVMARGNADIEMNANTNMAIASAGGVVMRAFLTLDISSGADGIVVADNIHSIQDMVTQHTKFAADSTGVNYFLFMAIAEKQGFKQSDFNHVPLSSSDAVAAFLAGKVDAIGASEPELNQVLQRKGAHILFTSKDYPGYISDVFAASQQTIAQKPHQLAAFAKCWYDTLAHIQSDPSSSIPTMAKRLGVSTPEMQTLISGIIWPDLTAGRQYLLGGGFRDSLQFANKFFGSLGQLSGPPVSPDDQITDVIEKQLG